MNDRRTPAPDEELGPSAFASKAGRSVDVCEQVASLRKARGLTLRDLAERSGVSRAMLSKVERGAANPSAVVLGKIAEALDVSISTLIGGELEHHMRLYRPAEQPVFTDARSGIERRSLSPILPNHGVDLVLNTLRPAGSSGDFPAHRRGVTELLYLLRGRLKVTVGENAVVMEEGDSLFFESDRIHRFDNLAEIASEFITVIDGTALRYR